MRDNLYGTLMQEGFKCHHDQCIHFKPLIDKIQEYIDTYYVTTEFHERHLKEQKEALPTEEDIAKIIHDHRYSSRMQDTVEAITKRIHG